MEILKCEGVRKLYGTGNNQVTALDRIDLSVEQGEFVEPPVPANPHFYIFWEAWIPPPKGRCSWKVRISLP